MFKIKGSEQKGTVVELVLLGIVLAFSVFLLVFVLKDKQAQEQSLEQPDQHNLIGIGVGRAKITQPAMLYNLNGFIKDIQAGALTLEANIPQVNAQGEPISQKEIRKVLLTPQTEFSRLYMFEDKQTGQQSIKQEGIALADLKKGDKIEVIASRNIKDALEFEAKQVRALP